MFATKKSFEKYFNDTKSLNGQVLNCFTLMSKRLDYAIERIARLEKLQEGNGIFMDKFLKATGYRFDYKPATKTEQSYEIVKIGKEKK